MSARRNPFFEFDPSKARGPRGGPDVGKDVTAEVAAAAGADGRAPLTVSALVGRIKDALAAEFPRRVAVVGELSNFKRHSSGHWYFRLKDAGASLDAVMFRSSAERVKFDPSDGLEVVAEGRVDVYDVRGQLQLYVERMTPKGAGALELAFRQLREKLQREGLFDPSAKRPIPQFPRAIGVVTSPTGAAVRDIRRTLRRRWPAATVYLMPSPVQGEGAAAQIAEAVRLLDAAAERLGIDTILVARGGGSLEDLWAFNEEAVARAVHAAATPIVSGVGHEVDTTICDLVADVRAATPTAAAELAVPDQAAVREMLSAAAGRLSRRVRQGVEAGRAALAGLCRSVVFRDPSARLRVQMQRVDELSHRMRGGLVGRVARGRRRLGPCESRLALLHPARLAERAAAAVDRLAGRLIWALGGRSKRAGDTLSRLAGRLLAGHPRGRLRLLRQQVESAGRQLEAMSYRSVLRRGFSVTRRAGGELVRSAEDVAVGDAVQTELADGSFRSRVEGPADGPPATRPTGKRKQRKQRKRPPDPGLTLFD